MIKKYPESDLAKEARERMGTIASLPEEPTKPLGSVVGLFPKSAEHASLAKVPELKNGTLIAQRQDTATDNTVVGQTPADHHDEVAATVCRRVTKDAQFDAVCVRRCWRSSALLADDAGCAAYHVGTQSLYAPDVATVYVPMIESGSYRRDLGERLTEAVAKEIELKTPYKVVGTPAADSILQIRLLGDTRKTLAQNAL